MAEYLTLSHQEIVRMARNNFAGMFQPGVDRGDTGRGLYKAPDRAFAEPYPQSLPKFGGQDLEKILRDRIKKRSRQLPFTVIDVGYGAGYYLLDVATTPEWTDKVRCIGYGPSDDTLIPYLNTPPSANALAQAGVELVTGDVIDIEDRLTIQADLLTVAHLMFWVEYPHWELLKKLYDMTAPGGIGLINACQFKLENSRVGLEKLLRQNGYNFEIDRKKPGDIAYKKTRNTLDLPVRDIWLRDTVAGLELI